MNKPSLIEQLAATLRKSLAVARQAERDASDEARDGCAGAEKRKNAPVAQEYSSLARGQVQRADTPRAELNARLASCPKSLPPRGPIVLGAVVEVEDDASGRTFFLAPAGGGLDLSGPGGDGFLSALTPASPLGRAGLSRRVGDTIEITVQGEPRQWTIAPPEAVPLCGLRRRPRSAIVLVVDAAQSLLHLRQPPVRSHSICEQSPHNSLFERVVIKIEPSCIH